jgi:adenine-specific DNA-methyltransferase
MVPPNPFDGKATEALRQSELTGSAKHDLPEAQFGLTTIPLTPLFRYAEIGCISAYHSELCDGMSTARKFPLVETARSPDTTASGSIGLRTKPVDRKTTWGIFYTPAELSRCLSEWAVESADDRVLEPSFGGCGFLQACASALEARGATHAWRQLCGCDKDARAFDYLPGRMRHRVGNRRFLQRNFLETKRADYCIRGFSVVIGNPPYVSRHNMLKYQISSADNLLANSNAGILSRRSSLWAYFVQHSLRFLNAGGRMAWVLPRSLSQSDYGRKLVAGLCGSFDTIGIISLQHRFFGEADEVTDILVGRGFRDKAGPPCKPLVCYASSLEELKAKLDFVRAGCALPVALTSAREELLTTEELRAYERIGDALGYQTLGELADIKIGIVTGATRFFVLKKTELGACGLTAECCKPLLTSSTLVRGLAWTTADQERAIREDERILLVRHDNPATRDYWKRFPVKKRSGVSTFSRRPVWNDPDDGKQPAAFCFSLVHDGPRLVVNSAGINANNSVYRIFLRETRTVAELRLQSLMMMSSYAQLSGELTGRVCGAGGLKFEPSDAVRLRLPRTPTEFSRLETELWSRVDLLLRNGVEGAAIAEVDAALLRALPTRISQEDLGLVRQGLQKLRNARRRNRVATS